MQSAHYSKRTAAILLALLLALSTLGAAWAETPVLSDTDYADMANWLRYEADGGNEVDIFMVYPTVTFSLDEADIPYVRLDSELMRESATHWLATAEPALADGNVYAPLYRQLNAAMLSDLDSSGFTSYTDAAPREDVFAAFDYYLRNINKGERPFILIGHSQGAQLAEELATVLLGDEAYAAHNKNHIATYAIGMSVTDEQIAKNPQLSFGETPDATGVILSWNTTAPSEVASGAYTGFGTWKPDARTVNPITWRVDEVLAHAADNGTSVVLGADGADHTVEAAVNAVVDEEHKVLVVFTVDESLYDAGIPTISKYHPYDLRFFGESIRQNMLERIGAFLRQ